MTDMQIIAKARAAKSPEELLKLAHENGMQEFTEENAKAYYETMHRSGELSDDELEDAAGGCKKNNRRIVTLGLICPGGVACWKCKDCLAPKNACHCGWFTPPDLSYTFNSSIFAWCADTCGTCAWCSYEGGMWYCNNAYVNKS